MPQLNKGSRTAHTVRVPDEHYAVFAAYAKDAGMELGPYLVWVLTVAHGLEPAERPRTQAIMALDLEGHPMAS